MVGTKPNHSVAARYMLRVRWVLSTQRSRSLNTVVRSPYLRFLSELSASRRPSLALEHRARQPGADSLRPEHSYDVVPALSRATKYGCSLLWFQTDGNFLPFDSFFFFSGFGGI